MLSGKKTGMHEEIEKIAHHIHDASEGVKDPSALMNKDYYEKSDEEIAYIIKRFFEYQ